jgi:G3E family GTPase
MSVPIFVISGFLGSGKTTFINYSLEYAPLDLKIMVLVNEFGTISIDRQIIKADPNNIVDLSGGCICCGLFLELMASLRFALDVFKADIILIESTGLAFPGEIARQALTPAFEGRIQFGGIITLMDASSIQLDEHPVVRKQLKSANVVILNKIDLIESSDLVQIREKIKSLMPSESLLFETSFGRIDFNEIFATKYDDTHLHRNDIMPLAEDFDSTAGFATITFVRHEALQLSILLKLYDACGNKIIRSKGFVITERGGGMELQLSKSGIEVKDTRKPIKRTELVLITKEKDKAYVEGKFRKLFDKNII